MKWSEFQQETITALQDTLHFLIGAPDTLNLTMSWSDLLAKLGIKACIVFILLSFYYIIHKLVYFFVMKLAVRFKLSKSIKDILAEGMNYLWWFASSIAVLSQTGVSHGFMRSYARAVFVAAFFFFMWRISNAVLDKVCKKYAINESLKQLLSNVSSVLIVVLAFGGLLKQFGFDLVSIVAGLGIAGIAVGFAAQSTLANFIAGVTILIERPFHIGDWVSINGHTGKIEKISLRTTHIRTRDNISIILPNNNVASDEIINLSARKISAYSVAFGIAYEEDIERTRQVVLEQIHNNFDLVLTTPELSVQVVELGDSSVNLIVKYWIKETTLNIQPLLHAQLLEAIKTTLNTEDIEIPYPHVQLMQNK